MLKIKFKKIEPFSKKTNETHFIGTSKASTSVIEKIFGEAKYIDSEYPNEIAVEFENGIIATIYNKDKYARLPWHVGGHDLRALVLVQLITGEIDKKQGIVLMFQGRL